jgi:hypothetical protein
MFFRTIQDELCLPFFDPEELIHFLVYLVPDFLAFLQAHQDELGVFSGKHHLSEIMVLLSHFFDGSNKTSHMAFLLFWLLYRWIKRRVHGVME